MEDMTDFKLGCLKKLVVCMRAIFFFELIKPFASSRAYCYVPGQLHRWRCDVLVLRWGAAFGQPVCTLAEVTAARLPSVKGR